MSKILMTRSGGGKMGGAIVALLLAVLLLLELSAPVRARPVLGLKDVHRESKSAKKERLIDMVTAGEASALLVSKQPAITAEEVAEEGADGNVDDAAASTDATADPYASASASASTTAEVTPEPAVDEDTDAADASSSSIDAGDDADADAAGMSSVASKFRGYLHSGVSAVKRSKPVSKTVSFFSKKYFNKGHGADDTTQDDPAAASDAAAAFDASDVASEGATDAAAAAAASSSFSSSSISDDEMRAVLAQAEEAEKNGINFVKPPDGNVRDATVRPSSPPPSLDPLSPERLREHYITQVVPVKPAKCEPSKITAADGGRAAQCKHVTETNACGGKLVHYLRFVYCNPLGTALPVALITLSLIVMLYVLATIADTFFCPALETVSTIMKLSPDVAGATLLALGNGAPDIFAQVAAVTSGDLPDVKLAVSSALGSGLFITTIILGAVILSSTKKIVVQRYAYQRDVLAYLVGVMLILGVLLGGTIALWHTTALAVFYCIYLCVVIFGGDGSSGSGGEGGGGGGGGGGDERRSGGGERGSGVKGGTRIKATSEPLFDLASQKGGPDDVKGTQLSRPPRPINLAVLDRTQVGVMHWVMDEVRWEEKGALEKCFSPITIPIQLAMTLTMPVVREGNLSKGYTTALAFFAPLFFLSTPATVPLLATLLPGSPWMYVVSCAALVCMMAAMILSFEKSGPAAACEGAAALTFVQSVMWMHLAADELVLCIDALGKVAGISEDFLGATVLAWGNCVGDLMSNLAVARAGQAPMAVAACFAGPLFNLLVGLAASLIYVNLVVGDLKVQTSNSMFMLLVGSVASLVACVVGVRASGAWELPKPMGWALLGFYGVFTVVYSLTEIGVVFSTPWM